MQKIQLICLGKLKEEYWRLACEEYVKRLSVYCSFSITELQEHRLPGKPSPAQVCAALKEEGGRVLSAAGSSYLAALCVEGKMLSSEQFAGMIGEAACAGASAVSFVIGSSYGLSDEVKRKASLKLSLSSMTFPHQLARVMLCEQIYRAYQILNNGKYHK